MRFVRFRTTVSKISDEKLSNIEDVIAIVNLLKEKDLDCAIKLKDGPIQNLVRIINSGPETFLCKIRKNRSILNKTVRYDELTYLEINTEDDKIARIKPNMTRWFLLGHADLDDV